MNGLYGLYKKQVFEIGEKVSHFCKNTTIHRIAVIGRYFWAECRRVLCGDTNLYERNLSVLMKSGRPVVLRVPVIGNYTDTVENRRKVVKKIRGCVSVGDELLEEYKKEILEIFDNAIPVEICSI